jgi:hypothetical protein
MPKRKKTTKFKKRINEFLGIINDEHKKWTRFNSLFNEISNTLITDCDSQIKVEQIAQKIRSFTYESGMEFGKLL